MRHAEAPASVGKGKFICFECKQPCIVYIFCIMEAGRDESMVYGFCQVAEVIHACRLNGRACRHLQARRLERDAVFSHFIMEVGAGGQTRHADMADKVSLLNVFPVAHAGGEF